MRLLQLFTEQYECDICGKRGNKALMQVLIDGRICQECFDKLGKGRFTSKYTIHEAKQKILDVSKSISTNTSNFPFPYKNREQYEMACRRDKYIFSLKYKKLSDEYYNDLTRIDTLWSVLHNLNDFNGPKALEYEAICQRNIDAFKKIYQEFCIPYNTIEFDCVPAYKRLAMLYEKQKKYEQSTLVCLDAIQHNAPNEYGDGGTGKMYARLARMAKKAGLLERPDIKLLISENKE